jgi:signal peptidase II
MTQRMRKFAPAARKISTVPASDASMRSLGVWVGFSALLVVLDQITKSVIRSALVPGQSIDVLPPVVTLVLAYNPGAAFSFLASGSGWQRYFFLIIALIASALIIYMMTRHRSDRFLCFALALVLGGAVGNLIDRVVYGAVVDFVLVRWPGGPRLLDPWPAFNLADSCITVGAALLIWDSFRRSRGKRQDTPGTK